MCNIYTFQSRDVGTHFTLPVISGQLYKEQWSCEPQGGLCDSSQDRFSWDKERAEVWSLFYQCGKPVLTHLWLFLHFSHVGYKVSSLAHKHTQLHKHVHSVPTGPLSVPRHWWIRGAESPVTLQPTHWPQAIQTHTLTHAETHSTVVRCSIRETAMLPWWFGGYVTAQTEKGAA